MKYEREFDTTFDRCHNWIMQSCQIAKTHVKNSINKGVRFLYIVCEVGINRYDILKFHTFTLVYLSLYFNFPNPNLKCLTVVK